MVDIPEHLLIRSAEARAKALGISVEQALAEMKGEATPTIVSKEPEVQVIEEKPLIIEESAPVVQEEKAVAAPVVQEEKPVAAPVVQEEKAVAAPVVQEEKAVAAPVSNTEKPVAVEFSPEVKVTQRLLTVVKAKPIQKSVSEPIDKVNTWPHLMLPEFVALMSMTAFLVLISAILQAPLLAEANPNVTPNPAKAPWYFLGLQELLSYWDPQIAGVMIPLVLGVVLFMAFPYIDRNPETNPSKRKFAIMFYTFFLAGAGILTIIGVLFRGPGWNWTYPWIDGIWFDDLLDWINFE